ncbi:hypothetical protein AA313_de0207792 [Arthrobotrys entomopaga]|nr:hypothetical protein AA313_de0207792 [Arthrobotrys entomopaga]
MPPSSSTDILNLENVGSDDDTEDEIESDESKDIKGKKIQPKGTNGEELVSPLTPSTELDIEFEKENRTQLMDGNQTATNHVSGNGMAMLLADGDSKDAGLPTDGKSDAIEDNATTSVNETHVAAAISMPAVIQPLPAARQPMQNCQDDPNHTPEYIKPQPLMMGVQYLTEFQTAMSDLESTPIFDINPDYLDINVDLHLQNRDALTRSETLLRKSMYALQNLWALNNPPISTARAAALELIPPLLDQHLYGVHTLAALKSVNEALAANTRAYTKNEKSLNPSYNFQYTQNTPASPKQSVMQMVKAHTEPYLTPGEQTERAASALVQLSEPNGRVNALNGSASHNASHGVNLPPLGINREHQSEHEKDTPADSVSPKSGASTIGEDDLDWNMMNDEVRKDGKINGMERASERKVMGGRITKMKGKNEPVRRSARVKN